MTHQEALARIEELEAEVDQLGVRNRVAVRHFLSRIEELEAELEAGPPSNSGARWFSSSAIKERKQISKLEAEISQLSESRKDMLEFANAKKGEITLLNSRIQELEAELSANSDYELALVQSHVQELKDEIEDRAETEASLLKWNETLDAQVKLLTRVINKLLDMDAK